MRRARRRAKSLPSGAPIRHGPFVKPSLTDELCTRCGLCCDGSLFADVELAGREATPMEILGLDVEADDADGMVMSQPCLALKGKRCSIYEHRPKCCRTFECRLLQNVRRGGESIQGARERITKTHANIAKVTEGKWAPNPDLSKVEEIGWTDLMPGGGTPASSRLDWIEVYARAVPRGAAKKP